MYSEKRMDMYSERRMDMYSESLWSVIYRGSTEGLLCRDIGGLQIIISRVLDDI